MSSQNNQPQQYDVAVVGAGSAGLQAAQTLGRMHRRVVVLGTDRYRNDPADAMHNFLGHDGQPPAQLRAAGRADAERYETVTFVDREVSRIVPLEVAEGTAFRLDVADHAPVTATRVLLATGVVDTLPDVPGLGDLWGDLVAHCPFCHGHEFAGQVVGVLGDGPHLPRFVGMLAPIAARVVVLTDGVGLDPELTAGVERAGAAIVTDPVVAVRRDDERTGVVVDLGGEEVRLGGLFVKTDWHQAAPFADQLGLDLSPVGAVLVDPLGHTSRPGVYAAGDIAQLPGLPQPMASVLIAAASGLMAAAACVQDHAGDLAEGRPAGERAA